MHPNSNTLSPAVVGVNNTEKKELDEAGELATATSMTSLSVATTATEWVVSLLVVAAPDIAQVKAVPEPLFLRVNVLLAAPPGAAVNCAYRFENVPSHGITHWDRDSVVETPSAINELNWAEVTGLLAQKNNGWPAAEDTTLKYWTPESVGVPDGTALNVIVSPAVNDAVFARSVAAVAVSDIVTARLVAEPFFITVNVQLLPAPGAVVKVIDSFVKSVVTGINSSLALNVLLYELALPPTKLYCVVLVLGLPASLHAMKLAIYVRPRLNLITRNCDIHVACTRRDYQVSCILTTEQRCIERLRIARVGR